MINPDEIQKIREDFPILHETVRDGKKLVYLDNAATTQKPKQVVNAISEYYLKYNANVHRGIHALSEIASDMYDEAHQRMSDFLNAGFKEVAFVRNTTEALNVFTYGYEKFISKGDEIVVSRMEHHSNMIPFMKLAERTGATFKYIELNEDNSELDLTSAEEVITDKTKIVSVPHMSNVLGTINPVKKLADITHDAGALFVLDGAQSVPHMKVDVKDLKVDFMGFSGHKMMAPMGSGGFYGREELLDKLEPLFYGGDMIKVVTYKDVTWNDLPWKFEAGTPNVGGGIGLGAAVEYLQKLTMNKVRGIEHYLTEYAMKRLTEYDWVRTYGPSSIEKRGGVISFNVYNNDGMLIHPHDVATLLDEEGIAIRAGHHCAQPLTVEKLCIPATNRMSFYIYNTTEEIDFTIDQLENVHKMFS